MRAKNNVAKVSLLSVFLIMSIGCGNKKTSEFGKPNICKVSYENGGVEIISESMGIHGLQQIDLSNVWDKHDAFYFPYLNPNYRGAGEIYLDIQNNGDKLLSAEELIQYKPSIWSEERDPVIQYIELSDLGFVKHKPLKIKDDIIVYPQLTKVQDSEIDNYFSSITKEQLRRSVDNYYNSDDCIYLEKKSIDKSYYQEYVNRYHQGDYKSGQIGEMFDILDSHHEIVINYQGKSGKYAKSIFYYINHGN